MEITLSPIRADRRLSLHREGDVLTFNNDAIDLSHYDAGVAPCDWIVGDPVLGADGWAITVMFPYGPGAADEALFPDKIVLTGDGPVPLPQAGAPESE